jgi:hypothetical protein
MQDRALRMLLWFCGAQAAVTLLAGLNLVVPAMAARVGVAEFVRWREMFSLLFVTPVSAGLVALTIWSLERGRGDAAGPLCAVAVSVCLLGIAMGAHEPINPLRRFAGDRLAGSLFFWDEVFGHAVFFIAYAGISLSVLWSQMRNPLAEPMRWPARGAFLGCGVVTGLGIFCSLAKARHIGADLAVIGTVIALSEAMRRGRPFTRLPLCMALELAYALALAGLVIERI